MAVKAGFVQGVPEMSSVKKCDKCSRTADGQDLIGWVYVEYGIIERVDDDPILECCESDLCTECAKAFLEAVDHQKPKEEVRA
jgi:hypothetical protein